MMQYDPNYWRHDPGHRCTPYWERIPNVPYRPPMNHCKHRDKYFYTVLFLDNYFKEPQNQNYTGMTIYTDITATFSKSSPVQWDSENPDKLIIHHNLRLPVSLEIWDETSKPLLYAPILKQGLDSITIGTYTCTVNDNDNTIIINFNGSRKPVMEEKFLLGIKEIPDFRLDPVSLNQSETLQTLEQFMAVPKYQCVGLAIVFRRNSLEALFDLISDFDEAYFKSMEDSTEIKYLVKKSGYKDLWFSTAYTDNLQDVINLIDVSHFKVEYSWEDHKKYKDEYNDYAEKYGYR